MDREIVFRGKRVDNGEWVYGDLLHNSQGVPVWITERAKPEGMQGVDPATVGQFIGFRDKGGYGQEIYRGDIVRITAACGEEGIGEVVWDKLRAGWSVDSNDLEELLDFANIIYCEHLVEVIGNIYDNSELLEVSNNG